MKVRFGGWWFDLGLGQLRVRFDLALVAGFLHIGSRLDLGLLVVRCFTFSNPKSCSVLAASFDLLSRV